MSDSRVPRHLLAPRHWPAWLLAGLWYLLAQLPYRLQWWLARILAPLLKLNKKRLHQAQRNLELCFPELTDAERDKLLKENMASTAMALFETGIAWFWPKWRLRRLYTVKGLEYLDETRREGQGVLLLSMHFTTLDIGCAMLGEYINYDGMYRPHSNPVYDYLQKMRRRAYAPGGVTIPRDSVRTLISRLRQGRIIWYAPDRDLGPKNSVFVPFFGVKAATLSATGKLAQMGRAQVIPYTQWRLPGGRGYELVVHPPFENYPTGDEYEDARRVNAFMEQEVSRCPEQYFWAQPRFKTRPPGEEPIY
ncbi:LpxL/LpxP family Kdo(2)-lipid IV(A) lauroyl/palmitoleoyl acyltransferase [Marinimicrobium sp. ABcell2]|uniref:LpxL/LpxP family Kdo(2)-lipid IV(A) lauroyl/palmitoleoyl acyltransferase n=1 Tax=Marinimicrobium sp. ABcell2 TaxID=3069751 RepID=UPI0027B29F35|nr:LpxL/LpxP family Kdo(2)-lipid IV(A) lauroyl/palmitoleoyl acyltransferase [Marinimicrobium sp. ABcell2]MDQ2077960.1 LpxL/LpxP family Kdo(2)-lipid IV(A) lauroyl/palmitoleoyl acyltransferase [Marinimicrobium sp. ABcell2]